MYIGGCGGHGGSSSSRPGCGAGQAPGWRQQQQASVWYSLDLLSCFLWPVILNEGHSNFSAMGTHSWTLVLLTGLSLRETTLRGRLKGCPHNSYLGNVTWSLVGARIRRAAALRLTQGDHASWEKLEDEWNRTSPAMSSLLGR